MEEFPFTFLRPLPKKCEECKEPECFKLAHTEDLIKTFKQSPIVKMEGVDLSVRHFLNYYSALTDKEGIPICQSNKFNPG